MTSDLLKLADDCFAVLRDFPADGQLHRLVEVRDTVTDLHLAGFVELHEVKKPCKCCGVEKFDYAYWRITGGGRLFMAAMERALATKGNDDAD